MSENLSKTQTLLIQLDSNVRTLTKAVEEIEKDTKQIPVIAQSVETHERRINHHSAKLDAVNSDLSKAKGWGAAMGAIGGILTSLFSRGH